jgi:AmmeMemoRadiSam system protein B
MLEEFFTRAERLEEDGPRPSGTLRGLVAPHIDIRVGGACAALAYGLLEQATAAETVIILGTAHGCPRPAWIVAEKPFETPLGLVPLDDDACRRLGRAAPPSAADLFYHSREHSIEFQALFLAKLRRRGRALRMVPVLCGSLREEVPGEDPSTPASAPDPPAFIEELRGLMEDLGERAVVIAAADMAHVGVRFGDPQPLSEKHLELLEKKDRQTLQAVTAGDARGFFASVMESGDPRRICGLSPIYGLLSVVSGARGKLLRYEQTVDATGTVSYAAVALWG